MLSRLVAGLGEGQPFLDYSIRGGRIKSDKCAAHRRALEFGRTGHSRLLLVDHSAPHLPHCALDDTIDDIELRESDTAVEYASPFPGGYRPATDPRQTDDP